MLTRPPHPHRQSINRPGRTDGNMQAMARQGEASRTTWASGLHWCRCSGVLSFSFALFCYISPLFLYLSAPSFLPSFSLPSPSLSAISLSVVCLFVWVLVLALVGLRLSLQRHPSIGHHRWRRRVALPPWLGSGLACWLAGWLRCCRVISTALFSALESEKYMITCRALDISTGS
ncbi:uncharacterized protein K452DRAFT_100255 [Aplosporella prunicola CBS 121167]|uniref:Uncharacterized protein n=1 Tax=Aplosporella prunicola CBS 121167 TaxID=1176127 RepID=A0A6A6B346_9PEZI|nr:uncharacterized protein K452DRAFT_100255 [Aplosporella prunicola CBS 121167]KAF2137644.1 hypothetical protein K452DRAFT_100255 [Aplosporella prunicola CBS 121167]